MLIIPKGHEHRVLVRHAIKSITPDEFSWEYMVEILGEANSTSFIFNKITISYQLLYEFDYSAACLYMYWMVKDSTFIDFTNIANRVWARSVLRTHGYAFDDTMFDTLQGMLHPDFVLSYKRRTPHELT